MYCPACGVENSGEDRRFCRSCGTDLRVVSQALSKSVPVKIASTLDAYLENRFQRNFMNGVLNLIAFLALVIAGTFNLISGWTVIGGLLLGLGLLSLLLGIWDIWIYRRNLPLVATQKSLEPTPTTKELTTPHTELSPPVSVVESTNASSTTDEVNSKGGGAKVCAAAKVIVVNRSHCKAFLTCPGG